MLIVRGLLACLIISCLTACQSSEKLPNFIIIFCDDLGYGDIGAYGNTVHRTPALDRMAAEGVVLTDFYVSSGLCTPSRASLMTGSYGQRVDMHINTRPWGSVGRQVLFPRAHKGLNPQETTIAELLQDKGYRTACIGKWHLGDQPNFLPTKNGFDYYYGIPYSNDMNRDFCPLPLMRNDSVIEAPVDQATLTQRYTQEALDFIAQDKSRPFFLYLPHAMTHNPLYASADFKGKSNNGIYGDAVEEIDWSTGQILDFLRKEGLSENTMVLFTSDNGAARPFGGTNKPLSGWKGSTMEGGMRVPGIFWWPSKLPARKLEHEMATTMDLLPTIAKIVDAPLPDVELDGHDILPLLRGERSTSPYDYFYYYQLEHLQAIRKGQWKIHLPLDSMYQNFHRATMREGRPVALYDLSEDDAENQNVADLHPQLVEEFLEKAEQVRQELGDLGVTGNQIRPAALVEKPTARLKE